MWKRQTLFTVAMATLATTGCKVNGKSIGWPGGSQVAPTAASSASNDSSDSSDSSDSDARDRQAARNAHHHGDDDAPATVAIPAAPAWCHNDGNERLTLLSSDLPKLLDNKLDATGTVEALLAAVCYPDEEIAPVAAQIETARKAWAAKLGMTEADWADAAEWVRHRDRHGPSLRASSDTLAWSAYTPIDQYAGLLTTTGFSTGIVDPSYLADAFGAKLSQAGRLGYITRCLEGQRDPAVRFAMCQPDIEAFDPKALAVELRSDTSHSGYERMVVRLASANVQVALVEHAAAVKALVAKDSAYGKLFTLARAAHQAWAKPPTFLHLVSELDDARVTNSRKAVDGCEQKTWAAWETVVGAIPASKYATLQAAPDAGRGEFIAKATAMIIAEPDGYLAALALQQCARLREQPDALASLIGDQLSRWPGLRGPRTATQTAILTAGITLDDRAARLEYPEVARPFINGGTSSSGSAAAVASVTINGDKATIAYAAVKFTQTVCAKGRYTNHVTQINGDGTLEYEYVCTQQRTESGAEAPPTQTVSARYVHGLTAGMVVKVMENVVTVAYRKGDPATPAFVSGVAVK